MTDKVLLQRLEEVVDQRVGIIRWMVDANLQADEPPIHITLCEFTNPLKMPPQRITDELWQSGSVEEAQQNVDMRSGALNPVGRRHATGAGLDRATSLWASVGEACERYAMHLDDGADAVRAARNELEGEVYEPRQFILFSEQQHEDILFPFRRWNPDRPLLWRRALRLSDGQEVWLPAQFVSGPLAATEFQPLDSLYSTGCAAGSTPAHAVSSGLRETVERDAFMFYWLSKTVPKRLDPAALSPLVDEALRPLLTWPGLDINMLWLAMDHGIPVIATIMRPLHGQGVAIGASCHPDWRQALTKAVVEAYHTLNWISDMDRWDVPAPDQSQLRDFKDHVAFYRAAERAGDVDFLLGGETIRLDQPSVEEASPDFRDQVRLMVQRLSRVGLEPCAVDLTSPDLFSVDMHVAKVLVPGMHPIHAGTDFAHLDRRRIDAVCDRLGLPRPTELNRSPHPFP